MPQVTYTPGALRDMQRLREFLRSKSPDAAQQAGNTIARGIALLGSQPQMGRPVEHADTQMREQLIAFGNSGYLVLYRVNDKGVTVLAFRHQKEVGY